MCGLGSMFPVPKNPFSQRKNMQGIAQSSQSQRMSWKLSRSVGRGTGAVHAAYQSAKLRVGSQATYKHPRTTQIWLPLEWIKTILSDKELGQSI
jgi:hypothetical protein